MHLALKNRVRAMLPKSAWGWLRLLRIGYTLASYRRRRTRHGYGGYELELELIDPMGEGWYDHDWPLLPEIAFLQRHRLRPGAKVFDIGAHQCVVAMVLSRIVEPDGFVVAVEANPENCSAGRRNVELNGIRNCQILHAAGAAQSGTLLFNRGLNGQIEDGSGEWGKTRVKAVSVDDMALEYGIPDVLFIDVEGFECAVLKGAKNTLTCLPDCFIEMHVGVGLEKFGGSAQLLLSCFPPGYQFFAARPEGTFDTFEEDSPLVSERFFLIAVHPSRPAICGPLSAQMQDNGHDIH